MELGSITSNFNIFVPTGFICFFVFTFSKLNISYLFFNFTLMKFSLIFVLSLMLDFEMI